MLLRAIRISSIISVPIWVNRDQIYPPFGNFSWSDGKSCSYFYNGLSLKDLSIS